MRPIFHFRRRGQEDLKLALILIAIDPRRGVLITGERAPPRARGARTGCAAAEDVAGKSAPFVELPIGATEDRVVGSLDLSRVCRRAARNCDRIARSSDGGVLYVDEVNLLPTILSTSADAASSGWSQSSDGLSAGEAAGSFGGTMNPEEGECDPSCRSLRSLVQVRASHAGYS